MTNEQIEKLRDDIKDRQPGYDDGEIDELCNLALKSLRQDEELKRLYADAARYRFIREIDQSPQVDIICWADDAAALDAAIDKAMACLPQEQGGSDGKA